MQNSSSRVTDLSIFADPLTITNLKPYTVYTVRLAALNVVGPGLFSEESDVRTEGIGTFFHLFKQRKKNIFLIMKCGFEVLYLWGNQCQLFFSIHIGVCMQGNTFCLYGLLFISHKN